MALCRSCHLQEYRGRSRSCSARFIRSSRSAHALCIAHESHHIVPACVESLATQAIHVLRAYFAWGRKADAHTGHGVIPKRICYLSYSTYDNATAPVENCHTLCCVMVIDQGSRKLDVHETCTTGGLKIILLVTCLELHTSSGQHASFTRSGLIQGLTRVLLPRMDGQLSCQHVEIYALYCATTPNFRRSYT